MRLPPLITSAPTQIIPLNADALEPTPVANNNKAQILSEIQAAGSGGRSNPNPNPSTSLFRADLPINHLLKPLLNASLGSIFQAPRSLQSFLTAWRDFKTFISRIICRFPIFPYSPSQHLLVNLTVSNAYKQDPLEAI